MGEYDKIDYNQFKNAATQIVQTEQFYLSLLNQISSYCRLYFWTIKESCIDDSKIIEVQRFVIHLLLSMVLVWLLCTKQLITQLVEINWNWLTTKHVKLQLQNLRDRWWSRLWMDKKNLYNIWVCNADSFFWLILYFLLIIWNSCY
jgi:hypothetical protein